MRDHIGKGLRFGALLFGLLLVFTAASADGESPAAPDPAPECVGGSGAGHGGKGKGCGGGCGGCGGCGGHGRRAGAGHGRHGGHGGPTVDGTDPRDAIHFLLAHHEKIVRSVEEIDGGVTTVTTSEDPEVADRIRTHVREMKRRVEEGRPMRRWDPLFAELFRHADAIRMEVEDVEGGVRTTETSADPQVAALIRQHARGVSEFVEEGFARAHRETPLPEGYVARAPAP